MAAMYTPSAFPPAAEGPELPPIYCPLEPRIHPDCALITVRALDWMSQFPFDFSSAAQAKVLHSDAGDLIARILPQGTRAGLEACTKLYLLGFAFDDLVEKLSETRLREAIDYENIILRLIDNPHSAILRNDPYGRAFVDMTASLRELASAAVWRRWTELNRMFASGVMWASAYRHDGTVPTLDAMTMVRSLDAGGPSYATGLIEIANDFEVPAEEFYRDDVRTLTDITWAIVAWDNDIYSYLAEAEHALENVNFVTALVTHMDLQPRDAIAEAIRVRNKAMWCYLEIRRQMGQIAGTPLRRYLTGLDDNIRGHLDWALTRPRRYGTSGDHNLSLTLYEEPATEIDGDDLTVPVELPSIRWWWNTLSSPQRAAP